MQALLLVLGLLQLELLELAHERVLHVHDLLLNGQLHFTQLLYLGLVCLLSAVRINFLIDSCSSGESVTGDCQSVDILSLMHVINLNVAVQIGRISHIDYFFYSVLVFKALEQLLFNDVLVSCEF